MEQRAVACAEGDEVGHHRGWGIVEYQSVEYAVDNVPRCAGQYEGEAYEVAPRYAPPYGTEHVDGNQDDEDDAEGGEKELVDKFPPESHAVVFGKKYVEPVRHADWLVEVHTRLNGYLDGLVNGDNSQEDQHHHKYLALAFAHLWHC